MTYDSLYRIAEQKNENERHQFYAACDRIVKLMPESLRLRRRASLEPEGEDNGND